MKLAIATLFLAAVASARSWGRDGERDRGNNWVKKYYYDENYRCGKEYDAKHDYEYECDGKCGKRECCEEKEYFCDDFKCNGDLVAKYNFEYKCDGKCNKHECCKEEKRNNGMNDRKWNKGDNDKRNKTIERETMARETKTMAKETGMDAIKN
ncbi:hypothetical protein SARC_05825 [Sphaeroforma arctica JP610]|uniref:Uncharacterized protein n=1 Tax=Sphaeroforma arctica JP610 TaxID=667725 RepID=A0A0L0FZ15_9EUKA|nr:hypothetical protein SARC_05825 [Sphaeroforma arctica JP610]KNC81879.1 hypothetical protein SARC_05825 [Sphaeroforma arctica JP610]|eukprot:XP_014155781.1 hypothetical protein SARC_05825 [Sphaeroforma arctica JP610]